MTAKTGMICVSRMFKYSLSSVNIFYIENALGVSDFAFCVSERGRGRERERESKCDNHNNRVSKAQLHTRKVRKDRSFRLALSL